MFARALLFSVLAVRALTRTASSSSSSSVPTETLLNLFIPPGFLGSGFVGSVIQADLCATTYGIACTSGFKNAKTTWFCNPSSTVYATYASSSYGLSTQYTVGEAIATTIQTCSLDGTSKAVCSITYGASDAGQQTSSSTVRTLLGQEVHFNQVPITAAANKLSNLAACTFTSNAAAATGISQVFKVLVVPGAAALLAGALT